MPFLRAETFTYCREKEFLKQSIAIHAPTIARP